LGISRLSKLNLKKTFALKQPRFRNLAIAAALSFFATVLLDEFNYVQTLFLPLPDTAAEQLAQMLKVSSTRELLSMVLAMAMVPAICEEFFFRGYLLSCLSSKGNLWQGIMVSSVLFGFFHQNLIFLLPASLAGLLFAFILQRTGNLCYCIAAHFIINAWSIFAINSTLPSYMPWTIHPQHVPWYLLVVSAVGIFFLGIQLESEAGRSQQQGMAK
jgi:sodium transport system permease protein